MENQEPPYGPEVYVDYLSRRVLKESFGSISNWWKIFTGIVSILIIGLSILGYRSYKSNLDKIEDLNYSMENAIKEFNRIDNLILLRNRRLTDSLSIELKEKELRFDKNMSTFVERLKETDNALIQMTFNSLSNVLSENYRHYADLGIQISEYKNNIDDNKGSLSLIEKEFISFRQSSEIASRELEKKLELAAREQKDLENDYNSLKSNLNTLNTQYTSIEETKKVQKIIDDLDKEQKERYMKNQEELKKMRDEFNKEKKNRERN